MGTPELDDWGAYYYEGETFVRVDIPVAGALKVVYNTTTGWEGAIFAQIASPVGLEIGLKTVDGVVDVVEDVCVTYLEGGSFSAMPANVEESLKFDGSQMSLWKMVNEILDNAFRFSKPGTPVQIVSAWEQRVWRLEISDRGRGMSPEQLARIGAFTQFDRQAMLEAGCDEIVHKPFREQNLFNALRKFLEVAFLYDTSDVIPEINTTADIEGLDIPVVLATCPPEFLRSLKYSAETTEVSKIASLIDSIREQSPQLARTLNALADDFEYEIILQHLRRAEELQHS